MYIINNFQYFKSIEQNVQKCKRNSVTIVVVIDNTVLSGVAMLISILTAHG